MSQADCHCTQYPACEECHPPATDPAIPRWDSSLPTGCDLSRERPQWKAGMCWIGVDLTGDLINLEGCDVGCISCSDFPDDLISPGQAVEVTGKRWLLPSPGVSQNRDARGLVRPLFSSVPIRVPTSGMIYLRAPCWDNYGVECFGVDSCSCFPASYLEEGDPPRCSRGESPNEILEGLIPDRFAYSGYNFSVTDYVQCRQTCEHGPLEVPLGSGPLFQPLFHNTTICAPNMLMFCAGAVAESTCEGSFKNTPRPNIGPPVWYNEDTSSRQKFDTAIVRSNTTAIDDEGMSPREKGEAALKNKVLRYLATRTEDPNFRQLDKDSNIVDLWSRSYDGAGLQAGSLPIIATLSGRTQQSGCPLLVQLRLVRATIQMSLIAFRMLFNGNIHVRPFARVRIRAECVATASLVNGENTCSRGIQNLPDGGLLHVVNGGLVPNVGSPNWPRVEPPLDSIVYLAEDGTPINPPPIVEWWGMLGKFSDPPAENVWPDFSEGHSGMGYGHDNEYGGSNAGRCLRLAESLSGLMIPAWPYFTHLTPDVPTPLIQEITPVTPIVVGPEPEILTKKRIYTGALVIGFP